MGLPFFAIRANKRVCAVDLTAVRSELANEYEDDEYAPVAESFVATAAFDPLRVQVVVRGDLEAFISSSACLSYRLVSPEPGLIALLVQDGSASFTSVTVGNFAAPGDLGPFGSRGDPPANNEGRRRTLPASRGRPCRWCWAVAMLGFLNRPGAESRRPRTTSTSGLRSPRNNSGLAGHA